MNKINKIKVNTNLIYNLNQTAWNKLSQLFFNNNIVFKITNLNIYYYSKKYRKNIYIFFQSNLLLDSNLNIFIGKTGSGKTTIMQFLSTIIDDEVLSISFDSFEVVLNDREKKIKTILYFYKYIDYKKFIFYMRKYNIFFYLDQNTNFFFNYEISIWKNFNIFINSSNKNKNINSKKRLLLLDRICNNLKLNINYNSLAYTLSGGEKKRLLFGFCLYILKPKILFLDELSSGLDYENLQIVFDLLDNYKKETNSFIILITHNLEYFLKYSKKFIIIKKIN